MERNVELTGGPLAGHQWPARPGIDRTLWIGIGADGGEYDGNTKLSGIAIYERTVEDDDARQFRFSRLEGPGERIAELGRRITALRACWFRPHASAPPPVSYNRPVAQTLPAPQPPQSLGDDADAQIIRSVIERWRRDFNAAIASPRRIDGNPYIAFIVPGEAEQFAALLAQHGIPTKLTQTTTQIRRGDSDEFESLPTGNVLFAPEDADPIAHALQMSIQA
jgi:hypothetical protein